MIVGQVHLTMFGLCHDQVILFLLKPFQGPSASTRKQKKANLRLNLSMSDWEGSCTLLPHKIAPLAPLQFSKFE